ncbi:Apextrin-like protein 2 [Plakobranchus ocellatus]|uniref:Apextrin-like protein 2 n=1 Tax=Plakobranchus ocellatus TaxID=259542 RepID=A0AAV4BQM1_9GAST|nr:Apextrin-like protein 2 [Plakobranchus ocellatus]
MKNVRNSNLCFQNKITTKESKVNIGSQLDALAILRVMKNDKEEIEEKLGSLEDRTERYEQELKAATDEELSKLKEKLDALEMDLNTTLADQEKSFELLQTQVDALFQKSQRNHSDRLSVLESRVQHVLDRGFLQLWPRGSYALPQPKSGCPSSAMAAFVPGYRRHHTESNSRNKDQVSEGNHLQPSVLERQSSQNYVYQRFCVKNDRLSPGPVWPAGTYCINKMEECPLFFEEGSIKWTDQGKGGESTTSGAVPNGQYTEASTRLFYCCRKDAAVDEPADLPRAQPFYLYRFGGKCQQVNGMSVTEEFIRFDTVNVNNSDEAVDPHPDGEINDVVLHLCYYQQI